MLSRRKRLWVEVLAMVLMGSCWLALFLYSTACVDDMRSRLCAGETIMIRGCDSGAGSPGGARVPLKTSGKAQR